MKTRQERIQELILTEIAEKSVVSGIVFGAFGIIFYFYGFGLARYLTELKIGCGIIVLASILRFMVSKMSRENQFWFFLRVRTSVWMNSIGWSMVFSVVALEHQYQGIHSVISVAMMFHFLTGSTNTLTSDKFLFIPFQLIIVIPSIAISLYQAPENHTLYVFTGAFSFIFLYSLVVGAEYRRIVINRFSTQLDLEASLLILQDQTEQLIQSSKLAALGEMAGGMAHEINNPLSIITLLVKRTHSLLNKESLDTEEMKSILSEIDETILRISKIIRGLRNVSRGAEGDDYCEVSVKEIFDDVLNICSEKFLQSHIDLKLIDNDLVMNQKIFSQRVQISQVMINLLGNAYDAVISHEVPRWVRMNLSLLPNGIEVAISNSGPLIQDAVKKKLFQPFFTTKEIGKGTGLGLSISKKIIEAHGGEIFLKDSADATTFIVRIPFGKKPAAKAS